jgi:putative FmdB family regulatory protein
MPLYEYRCSKCGHAFEVLVSSNSVEAPACPKCGALETEKQLSAFAVGRSGSGSGVPMPEGGCGSCCSSGSCPYADD